ncbi:MAG: redox-sensing transcriptional repressor Rex [Desulfovibrionaceae bacterium]|nr:redox-sensing transcriptional repressor Rex [Desulfovibrionaceae bacterium]
MPLPLRADKIPRASIQRLAVYLQMLERMLLDGAELVSSEMLAGDCEINAAQIRKDLTYFGEFGVRGVGYNVQRLISCIKMALGIDRPWNCVLLGVGNMGSALLNHREFRRGQYSIIAVFDSDPGKIGQSISGLKVLDCKSLPEYIAGRDVQLGIIATPPDKAQIMADYLVEVGVRGLLNFASAHVFAPDGVFVENVDFCNHLYALSFKISQQDD